MEDTEPVCVHYTGTYDPGQPEDHLRVQLFGAKRWYEDGWVYRLEGEVVVLGERDLRPTTYYYDDILVYMVQGKIFSASEEVFVDTTGEQPYTWDELEYLINNYEAYDSDADDVDPVTDEECMYVFMHIEEDETYWEEGGEDSDSEEDLD